MYYWDGMNLINSSKGYGFSSCQKNVLLGPLGRKSKRQTVRFQQLLEECTIGTVYGKFSSYKKSVSVVVRRMYYWDMTNSLKKRKQMIVSVVVRRMYYWDSLTETAHLRISGFSSCQKNVLLGLVNGFFYSFFLRVSVVVRRMYYWDAYRRKNGRNAGGFSSCQKNVLLGLYRCLVAGSLRRFSSCQKNVLLGRQQGREGRRQSSFSSCQKNVLLGPNSICLFAVNYLSFSSCQKNVLLGPRFSTGGGFNESVSVVVRRMYYWDGLMTAAQFTKLGFQQLLEECTIGT